MQVCEKGQLTSHLYEKYLCSEGDWIPPCSPDTGVLDAQDEQAFVAI